MTAWYEFEEIVGRIWHRWAAAATSYPSHAEAGVDLEPLRGPLRVYHQLLGGAPAIEVTHATALGSRHRLTLRQRLGLEREPLEVARRDARRLVLPRRLDVFPDIGLNHDLYFWLAAFLAVAGPAVQCRDPLRQDLHDLVAARAASARVRADLPGLARRHDALCAALRAIRPVRRLPPVEAAIEAVILRLLGADDPLDAGAAALLEALDRPQAINALQAPKGYRPPLPVPLWGQVAAATSADAGAPDTLPDPESDPAAGDDGTLRRAERRALDQPERDDPLLFNPFEKLLSFTEMVNVNRHVEDDETENARKAADQLEQLTLSEHRKQASTRLKMTLDVADRAQAEGAVSGPLRYPEWHFRRRRHLPDYCAVFPGTAPEREGRWQADVATRRRIRRVRRQFEALRPQRLRLHGQLDGDELDMDALIRSRTELAAGQPGSDRIHTVLHDQARDLAVSILVDVSLSTESWLEDRRVLDVEKEALLVLAHGIQACGDDQAIHAFSSRRRSRVQVSRVKDFDEPLDARVERRIAGLEPRLYTRMGAALRHVADGLAARPNRARLLLVLTDGKPNDTDHYEGRYAIEDTRMAVHEARMRGLGVFGVTVDAEARHYFPRIFGRGGFAIVPRAQSLIRALPAIYRQLTCNG